MKSLVALVALLGAVAAKRYSYDIRSNSDLEHLTQNEVALLLGDEL